MQYWIKKYQFENVNELTDLINFEVDKNVRESQIVMPAKAININSDKSATVIFEEDIQSEIVSFYYKGNPLMMDADVKGSNNICIGSNSVDLLIKLGSVTINDREYKIKSINYIIEFPNSKIIKIDLD